MCTHLCPGTTGGQALGEEDSDFMFMAYADPFIVLEVSGTGTFATSAAMYISAVLCMLAW